LIGSHARGQVEQRLDEDLAQAILRDEASDEAGRAGRNIKKLPLISHKAAANRNDALNVLAA
jgi:hypothetical protein